MGTTMTPLLGLCPLTHELPVLCSGPYAEPARSEWVGVQEGDSGGGLQRVKDQIIAEQPTEKK
jgi:hypothetical protein